MLSEQLVLYQQAHHEADNAYSVTVHALQSEYEGRLATATKEAQDLALVKHQDELLYVREAYAQRQTELESQHQIAAAEVAALRHAIVEEKNR